LQLLAVKHALLVYSCAEINVLRPANDTVEFEDMAIGLGGGEHVFTPVAEVESEDVGDSIVLERGLIALVIAHHF
jgi:hypothetical protein